MLIWGNKGYVDHLGYVIHECTECRHTGPCSVYQQKKKFTVYFVPTFSYSSKQLLECGRCKAAFEIPSSLQEKIASRLMSQAELSALLRQHSENTAARAASTTAIGAAGGVSKYDKLGNALHAAGMRATVRIKATVDPIMAETGKELPRPRATAGYVAHGFAAVWTGMTLYMSEEFTEMLIDDQRRRLHATLPQWGLNWTIEEINGAVGGVVSRLLSCEGSGGVILFKMANTILEYFVEENDMTATRSMAMVDSVTSILGEVKEARTQFGQQL